MQEFLIIIVIALVIFFLPRTMGRVPAPEPKSINILIALSGWMRLAILVTIFWIAGVAAFLPPWEGKTIEYLYVGLGPVVAVWGTVWVWFGYKKYRR